MFYVYALFREDGTPFWIGKGKGDRAKVSAQANRRRSYKQSIIKRTIRLRGDVPFVIIHEGLAEKTAFAYERALIAAIGRYSAGPLANMTDGGEGTFGVKYTPQRRAKMQVSMLGNTNSLGYVHTPETRAKVAAKAIGNQRAKGHKQSPEHIAKRVAAFKAWRAQQSETHA